MIVVAPFSKSERSMRVDVIQQIGAVVREVRSTEHEGKPAKVVVAGRTYSTTPEDLWQAVTDPERIQRWLLPVSGELRLGGRYQLEGNAGGTIMECRPPRMLALTWEYGGDVSWVKVHLTPESSGHTRLELEHKAIPGEHWKKFGPSAVGVGWDLMLLGLEQFITEGRTVDKEAWPASVEGKEFMRRSAEDWGRAHIAAGTPPEEAGAAVQRTFAAYSGEGDGTEASKS
jgi:uncharacterized protein YndB with AHSA1/START domain